MRIIKGLSANKASRRRAKFGDTNKRNAIRRLVLDINDMNITEDQNIGSLENYPILIDDEYALEEVNMQLAPCGLEVSIQYDQVFVRTL